MFNSLMRQSKVVFTGLWLSVSAMPAMAYVGPGAGLTLLGPLLGLIFAILFVLVGILLWPLRILWRRIRKSKKQKAETAVEGEGSPGALNENKSPEEKLP